MFAFRCRRYRAPSSLTRRLVSTLSNASSSTSTLSLRNPTDTSTVVHVETHKGYNVAEVVKAAAYGPVHLVRPFGDHVFLHYYAPADAAARSRNPIKYLHTRNVQQVYSVPKAAADAGVRSRTLNRFPHTRNALKVHSVPRTALPTSPTKETLSLFVDAAAIARLGYAHASRSLKIHWNGPAQLTEQEMLSTLTRFGFLENAVAYDDRDGENEVLNVVFFDERASSSVGIHY